MIATPVRQCRACGTAFDQATLQCPCCDATIPSDGDESTIPPRFCGDCFTALEDMDSCPRCGAPSGRSVSAIPPAEALWQSPIIRELFLTQGDVRAARVSQTLPIFLAAELRRQRARAQTAPPPSVGRPAAPDHEAVASGASALPTVADAPDRSRRWETWAIIAAPLIGGLIMFVGVLRMLLPGVLHELLPGGTAPLASPPPWSEARAIDPRYLAANPDGYKGANLLVQGQALGVEQRNGYTWVQLLARIPGKESGDESIVVELHPTNPQLLKGECYRLYGVGAGTQRVTRTLTGAQTDVPLLNGYGWMQSPVSSYGACSAPTP